MGAHGLWRRWQQRQGPDLALGEGRSRGRRDGLGGRGAEEDASWCEGGVGGARAESRVTHARSDDQNPTSR